MTVLRGELDAMLQLAVSGELFKQPPFEAVPKELRRINDVAFSGDVADTSGEPLYIGGIRGLVERNTMRYYLAIDAYLGSLSAPAAEQPERRFAAWFDATERYPRQLHEVDRDAYLRMKRSEYRRQLTQP